MDILVYPDERLRMKARPVEKVTDEIREIATKMIEIMHNARGVGLAATQVGVDKQIIIVNPKPEEEEDLVLLNPRIVNKDGRVIGEEGCLSVPGVRAKVRRSRHAVLEAINLDEEEVTMEGEELLAVIWQHEIDHLNGILFIDKVTPASRISVKRQLRELVGSKGTVRKPTGDEL